MNQNDRVIALGFFDGVHIGHGALLRCVTRRADELDAVPSALTFDTHPESLTLGSGTPLLTGTEERARLMREVYGIRDVLIVPFNHEMMHMDWRSFVTDLLVTRYHAVHLVVGHDFRFGYRGEGDPQRLQQLCLEFGIGCDVIPAVPLDGITVSSSHIRSLIAQGDVRQAERFLGHPHTLTDQVRHGKKLGTRLGFPTLNLQIPSGHVIPAFGVYATQVCIDGVRYSAATNVGVRPTVDEDGQITVEASLLNFDGDLYGKTVRLEFCHYLRPEQKFDTLDELRTQVLQDITEVRNYFE